MGCSSKRQKCTVSAFKCIVNAFKAILDSSKKKKRNKIRVDEGSEFCDKKWLDDNNIKMNSTYYEGKSVFSEIFIRTLKIKIYKHMTTVSKDVYFLVLDDIVDKYNNTYHKTIKMKPIEVKPDSMLDTMLILIIKILNLSR